MGKDALDFGNVNFLLFQPHLKERLPRQNLIDSTLGAINNLVERRPLVVLVPVQVAYEWDITHDTSTGMSLLAAYPSTKVISTVTTNSDIIYARTGVARLKDSICSTFRV